MKSNSKKVLLLCVFALIVIAIPIVYFVTKSDKTPDSLVPPPVAGGEEEGGEPKSSEEAAKAAQTPGGPKKSAAEVTAERMKAFKEKQGSGGDKAKLEAISRFLDASGVAQEFLSIDDMIAMQIDQIRSLDMPEEDKADFEEMLRKTFNGQEMLDSYIAALNAQMTSEELAELDSIYKDPLIAKDNETNAFIRTEEGQKDFADFMKTQMSGKEALSPDREAALKNLDGKSHMSENAFTMVNSMMNLMQDSMISVEKEKGRLTPQQEQEMRAAAKNAAPAMKAQFEQGSRLNLAYLNRNNSVEEINLKSNLIGSAVKQKEIAIRHVEGSKAFEDPEKARGITDTLRRTLSKDHGAPGGQGN